jgi:hypothetical protein
VYDTAQFFWQFNAVQFQSSVHCQWQFISDFPDPSDVGIVFVNAHAAHMSLSVATTSFDESLSVPVADSDQVPFAIAPDTTSSTSSDDAHDSSEMTITQPSITATAGSAHCADDDDAGNDDEATAPITTGRIGTTVLPTPPPAFTQIMANFKESLGAGRTMGGCSIADNPAGSVKAPDSSKFGIGWNAGDPSAMRLLTVDHGTGQGMCITLEVKSVHQGQFQDGLPHGIGTRTTKTGGMQTGTFVKGKLVRKL